MKTATYEDLIEEARKRSGGGWAAVVDITRYLGSSYTTVAVSKEGPIVSRQRGGEFVGVVSQFRDGRPMGRPVAATRPTQAASDDDTVLPF